MRARDCPGKVAADGETDSAEVQISARHAGGGDCAGVATGGGTG